MTTAAASTLTEIDATIARLESHIAEYNRVLSEIVPVKHLFHVPRDREAWPHLHGYQKSAAMIREEIAHCERRLAYFKRARLHLVPAGEDAA